MVALVRMVCSTIAFSTVALSLRRASATTKVRQAPMPDASIGVNRPAYMPPMVMTMMAMMAIDCFSVRMRSAVAARGPGGPASLRARSRSGSSPGTAASG